MDPLKAVTKYEFQYTKEQNDALFADPEDGQACPWSVEIAAMAIPPCLVLTDADVAARMDLWSKVGAKTLAEEAERHKRERARHALRLAREQAREKEKERELRQHARTKRGAQRSINQ